MSFHLQIYSKHLNLHRAGKHVQIVCGARAACGAGPRGAAGQGDPIRQRAYLTATMAEAAAAAAPAPLTPPLGSVRALGAALAGALALVAWPAPAPGEGEGQGQGDGGGGFRAAMARYVALAALAAWWAWACVKAGAWTAAQRRAARARVRLAVKAGGGELGVSEEWWAAASAAAEAAARGVAGVAAIALVVCAVTSYPASVAVAFSAAARRLWVWLTESSSLPRPCLFALLVTGGHMAVFWSMSVACAMLDVLRPHLPTWAPFKVQETRRLTARQYAACTALALFNEALSAAMVYGLGRWALPLTTGGERAAWAVDALPGPLTLVLHLAASAAASEVWFYWGHRLCHASDFLWKNVHWLHHTIDAPSAVTAIFAHPIEHVFVNFPTTALGPLLLGSHAATFVLWSILATFDTCMGHSGWHLPFLSAPEFHDYHHSAGTGNFGALGLLDALCGTSDAFFKTWHAATGRTYGDALYPVDKAILREEMPGGATEKARGGDASAPLLECAA